MLTNEYCRAKICKFLKTSCLVLFAVIVIFAGSTSWAMALRLSPASDIAGEVNQKLPEDSSETFEFEPKSGILAKVNQKFHDDYNERIEKIITNLKVGDPTVLVLFGGNITVYHKGKIKEHQFIPSLFHKLKAIVHYPVSLYTNLHPYEGQNLTDDLEDVLNLPERRRLLNDALEWLDTLQNPKTQNWSQSIIKSQQSLLKDSIAYVDKVLAEKRIDSDELNNYVNQVRPEIVEGINLAAAQELEFLNDKIKSLLQSDLKDDLVEGKWKSPYVVISGVHQARYGEIATQYFEHVLNEFQGNAAEREDRIVYAESIFDNKDDKALKLLATHILDQEISLAFFGEEKRLQRDALMDAASFWLLEHAMGLPKLAPTIKTK